MDQVRLLSNEEEAELLHLWPRRANLAQPGWERLWHLVTKALMRTNPGVLRTLPDSKQEYVTDFFLNKVAHGRYGNPEASESSLGSVRALATYFNNYLIDVYRSAANRSTVFSEDQQFLDAMDQDAEETGGQPCSCEGQTPEDLLVEASLLEAAKAFFGSLGEEEQLYLAAHTCDGEPLYKLAERHKIASYHRKAGLLGITRKKGELYNGYEKTRIGAWLNDVLKIKVHECAPSDVLEAFIALCRAAFMIRPDLTPGETK